jgi:hypothetical protein
MRVPVISTAFKVFVPLYQTLDEILHVLPQ